MSSTYYKVPYTDHFGFYGSERKRFLYVHEHHTSGVTRVVNEEGRTVYIWSDDSDEEAYALADIIRNCAKNREDSSASEVINRLLKRVFAETENDLLI